MATISKQSLLISVLIPAVLLPAAWAQGDDSCTPDAANRPVCPADAVPATATFIDPTASIAAPDNVEIGTQSYIAPFAKVITLGNEVSIGEKTNLQDNVIVRGQAAIGDEIILAHGARVEGPVRIGRTAVSGAHNAAFIGFNSLVERGNVQHDAMVLHLARVAPGITIKTGKVVLSGKNITNQAQADNPALGKVIPITDALRTFMEAVLHVNETFAREYTRLYQDDPTNVTGINYDPGNSEFNPTRDLPVLDEEKTRVPDYRNRIIGKIIMADSLEDLEDSPWPSLYARLGNQVALRADEGEPFRLGRIKQMADQAVFHALEHTSIDAHNDIFYGKHSLIHGGSSEATARNPESATVIGDRVTVGDYAVVFRSVLGDNVKVGCGSLVDGSTLPAGSVVPSRRVLINVGHAGAQDYAVEWNPGCG